MAAIAEMAGEGLAKVVSNPSVAVAEMAGEPLVKPKDDKKDQESKKD